jgi:hypothetical protein
MGWVEITNEQRKPGLKNPLTKEQVEDLRRGWGGFAPPTVEETQAIAEELLPNGGTISDILDRMADLV